MTQLLLPMPILLPLGMAIVLLLVQRYTLAQRAGAMLTAAAVSGLGVVMLYQVQERGHLVTTLGDWPAPFGIVLVADIFSVLMVTVTALVGIASLGLTFVTAPRWRETYIYPIFMFLLAGVNGAYLTGDLFNLYVFFEITLLASYALMAIGGRALQMEAAFKYVVINLIASIFFLVAVGLLYGMLGTLNLAQLALRVGEVENGGLVTLVACLLLSAFAVKAALIPLHFWLPGAYTHIPVGIAGFFGGVLTKVGVYAIVRFFTLIFGHDPGFFQPLLLTVAGVSMIGGVLGAAAQKDMRTILSYHIISQCGYMVMGVGLFTVSAVSASIFFILHNMHVKAALFLAAGAGEHLSGTGELKKLGGLARLYPLLGAMFVLPALSLAGVPPFSGFWGKVALAKAGFETGQFLIIGIALAVSLFTLFSMFKIWQWAFWGQEPADVVPRRYLALLPPALLLTVLTVAIGIGAQGVLDLTNRAAEQLMDPTAYITAVLGPGG